MAKSNREGEIYKTSFKSTLLVGTSLSLKKQKKSFWIMKKMIGKHANSYSKKMQLIQLLVMLPHHLNQDEYGKWNGKLGIKL